MSDNNFIRGLETRDFDLLRRVAKSDYHNHACLGYPLDVLRKHTGDPIPDPPTILSDFEKFLDYLIDHLHPYLYTIDGFEFSIDAALKQAASDGVTIIEMSVDAQMTGTYSSVEALVAALDRIDKDNPLVHFRPEIGINRAWDIDIVEKWVLPMIESGFFDSIDLYGNEKFGEPEKFESIFKVAKDYGLIRKAHAGEYQGAEFVRHSVDTLDLNEVQHGIASHTSKDVMKWLAERGTVLHVCPTSNVKLERVPSMAEHSIRTLYDHGVSVTINSDDIMVFGETVSEEFQNLFDAKVFSASELDGIRQFSLGLRDEE